MKRLGVLEIFFGPAWPKQGRLNLAPFLAKNNFDFYIYGPKSDRYLRKGWRDVWPDSYISELSLLARTYKQSGIRFGVALTPFDVHKLAPAEVEAELKSKMTILNSIGIEILGLFFDDMPVHDDLAQKQIEVVHLVRSMTKAEIVFCPSFYAYDPILDKVFGQRPLGYLDDLGAGIPQDVAIVWTGPKVISAEISAEHLGEVGAVLKRQPWICDNIFANDGPKNCQFLKLKPFSGRSPEAVSASAGWALNPMNQIEISKIVLRAAQNVSSGQNADEGLNAAIDQVCAKATAEFLKRHRDQFLMTGRAALPDVERAQILGELEGLSDPVACEIRDWINGEYVVGSDCLTD